MKTPALAVALFLLGAATPLCAAAANLLQASDAVVTPQRQATQSAGAGLRVAVDLPTGERIQLLLQPQRALMQAAKQVPAVRLGHTRVYAGHVLDQPDSWVRLTRIDDAWLGAIQVNGQLWLLDPARQHGRMAAKLGLGPHATLVYRPEDIATPGSLEGDMRLPSWQPEHQAGRAMTARGTPTSLEIELTLVLDQPFQQHYDANAEPIAVGVLNTVDGF